MTELVTKRCLNEALANITAPASPNCTSVTNIAYNNGSLVLDQSDGSNLTANIPAASNLTYNNGSLVLNQNDGSNITTNIPYINGINMNYSSNILTVAKSDNSSVSTTNLRGVVVRPGGGGLLTAAHNAYNFESRIIAPMPGLPTTWGLSYGNGPSMKTYQEQSNGPYGASGTAGYTSLVEVEEKSTWLVTLDFAMHLHPRVATTIKDPSKYIKLYAAVYLVPEATIDYTQPYYSPGARLLGMFGQGNAINADIITYKSMTNAVQLDVGKRYLVYFDGTYYDELDIKADYVFSTEVTSFTAIHLKSP